MSFLEPRTARTSPAPLTAGAPLLTALLLAFSFAPAAPATAEDAASAAAVGVAAPSPSPVAIFIVRHAEKETDVGRDPNLNEAGRSRAGTDLVELLDGAPIDAAYVTQWRRTQQTAAPLLERLGLEPEVVETDDGFEAALARRLLTEHPGETLLVVGHSNTNPALIEALGAPPPTIDDHDYDDVYLVLFPAVGDARLVRLGYGRPTP